MYQMNGSNPMTGGSGYYPPNPYAQYPRMDAQVANMYPQMQSVGQYLKGRPVASLEEARAAQIDLDGSLFIFTDIGNKKIYTKQINVDGTVTLNVYSLDVSTPEETQPEYVTKVEFNQALAQIQAMFQQPKLEEKKSATLKDF